MSAKPLSNAGASDTHNGTHMEYLALAVTLGEAHYAHLKRTGYDPLGPLLHEAREAAALCEPLRDDVCGTTTSCGKGSLRCYDCTGPIEGSCCGEGVETRCAYCQRPLHRECARSGACAECHEDHRNDERDEAREIERCRHR